MFTGIIRHLGTVTSFEQQPNAAIVVVTTDVASQVAEGDSVAVNGACLTALEHDASTITFRLMQETLMKTNLGELTEGAQLNLERSVAAGERFDGHFVLGHVDGVATISAREPVGDDRVFTFTPPTELTPFLIDKGSVAIDGVSLTVVEARDNDFTASIMPYTLEHTTFGSRGVGDQVNIELDMIAKHVGRIMDNR